MWKEDCIMDTNMLQNSDSMIEKVAQSINSFEQATQPTVLPVSSNQQEIIDHIVSCARPVDFNMIANNPDGKKANSAQKAVIVIDELQKITSKNNRNIAIMSGEIFIFNGVYWQKLGEDETKYLLGNVAEAMGYDPINSLYYHTKELLYKQLRSAAYTPEKSSDSESETVLINLRNGTLEITEKGVILREHRPEDKLTYCTKYDYEPNATCDKFYAFLNQMLPDVESQVIFFEYLGYILTKHLKLEKILLLLGEGRNGKSVIYEIVRKLFGEENVCNLSLEEITKDKGYCRIEMHHKTLNYGSDINDKFSPDILKKMASGEPVFARGIREKHVEMKSYAKQMYNANQLPKGNAEYTKAFFERFLIIKFNVTIEKKDINVNLAKEICETDLSGIFNLVLQGLQRILKQKRFSSCAAYDEILNEFIDEVNPINEFLSYGNYVHSTRSYMALTYLYEEYTSFCMRSRSTPVGYKVFSKLLKKQNFKVEAIGGKARQVSIEKQN